MYNKEYLERLKKSKANWESETLSRSQNGSNPENPDHFTDSRIPVKQLYTPLDLEEAGFDYLEDLGFPGEFPFARGLDPAGYRNDHWMMMQYSGFASAEETNKRFKFVLEQGASSFSIALDLPTHKGLDSDDPLAEGEVGKTGVPIDSLQDLEIIFDGVPLDAAKMFICVGMSTGPIILSLFLALAEKNGIDPNSFGLFLTNEALMEFVCRGTQFTTPAGHHKLSSDVIEYCTRNHPGYSPMQLCGYHTREAGATAIQELAFPLAIAITYIEEMDKRGFTIDDFAGKFSWFFSSTLDLFEEAAKFRAFRKVWAKIAKERFGAKNPDTWNAKIMIYTGGSNLTRQQPLNNIVRTTVQALGGVLGGVQWANLSSFDEAFQTPTEQGATIALRTQQILAHETGVTSTPDPLAGSYFVETLTKEIETKVFDYLEKIEEMGGAIKAIEKGFYQQEINENAFQQHQDIEGNTKIKVGLNKFTTDEKVAVTPLKYDPESEERIVTRLKRLRAERDDGAVRDRIDALRAATEAGKNVIPYILEAVKVYATVGEIGAVFRDV
ncbi:MAG: methylmalonyl-CoA mutase, partial [Rhodospirillaceae bacterium]|nr:methylmalonyl-CoA mutase [Rhodospirillaceae bacterium]